MKASCSVPLHEPMTLTVPPIRHVGGVLQAAASRATVASTMTDKLNDGRYNFAYLRVDGRDFPAAISPRLLRPKVSA